MDKGKCVDFAMKIFGWGEGKLEQKIAIKLI
jgi:hypothetical protein